MAVMSAIDASPPAAASWEFLKMSGRSSFVGNIHVALKIRGGEWVLGRSRQARRRTDRQIEDIEDYSTATAESDAEGQEYEYEYDYYDADEATEEGNDDVEYESYEEEENNDDANYDQYENNELVVDDEKYFDRGIEDDVSQGNHDQFFRGWGIRHTKEDTGNNSDTDASTDERIIAQIKGVAKRIPKGRRLIQVDYDGGNDEDRDNPFTTRIPAANQKNAQDSGKFRLMKLFPSNTDRGGKKEEYRKENKYQENKNVNEVDDDDDNSSDHLYETPIPKVKGIRYQPSSMKAARLSKANGSFRWLNTAQMAKKRPSGRKQSRHKSSSNASFISHPFSAGGSPRGVRPYKGKSHSSDWLYLLVAPIGHVIQSIARNAAAIISRWISTSWLLICNAYDFMWYGPVEGVTTTGIATREDGLSYFLTYAPVAVMSSVAILGLFSLLISRRWSELRSEDHSMEDKGVRSDDDEHEYDPSIEDELNFLHREFEAANPFSKKRIAVDLQSQSIKKRNQPLSKIRRGDGRPKSRRGQRQFTIKSIQTWWKERPSQQSIAIIEPQHLRNQQQPLGQEISRLQKKLAQSEQERAVLRQDVQHLQDKLQRVHNEAIKKYSQHQRLEKEASMADQIVSRAVQVERRKSNNEFSEVRESMKGVLGRERMLMRGRIVGLERGNMTIQGQNDLDIRKAPNKRILDGVKIVREIDLDREDDDDRNWKGKAL
jgi:hypothetical protein